MKLLFKQRLFSWFDSYDIYDEEGNTVFTVQGKLALGHLLQILDRRGTHIGTVKQELLTFLPRFLLYTGDRLIGKVRKQFSFFHPSYHLDCNGWQVTGDFMGWDYRALDSRGELAMTATKQLLNWTDTYVIEVAQPQDTLLALMVVLAIDAANCSKNS